jgi:hypothetical protein
MWQRSIGAVITSGWRCWRGYRGRQWVKISWRISYGTLVIGLAGEGAVRDGIGDDARFYGYGCRISRSVWGVRSGYSHLICHNLRPTRGNTCYLLWSND